MKKLFLFTILFTSFFFIFSCKDNAKAKNLSTELFNYSDEVMKFFQPLEKKSKLVSVKNIIPIISTKEFVVTNKNVIPFLHYQLYINSVDLSKIKKEELDEFFYMYGYMIAKNKLIEQEAMKKNISVTEEEVNKTLENITKDKMEDFKAFLNSTALTMDFTIQDIRQSLTIEKYQKEIVSKVEVSEDEVKNYYMNNPTISKLNPKVQAKHILIKFKPIYNKEAALKKITEVKKMLQKGKKFEDMVKKYSDDEYTKNNGGSFGDFVSVGDLSQSLQDAVFSTKEGEISDIVELPNGYSIVKVEKIESEGEVDFNNIKDTINKILIYNKQNDMIEDETKRIEKESNLKYNKI